ncbi:MAG TPA: L-fucose/L-arabinose isomerase family protein [Sphaerochaeta sp.]|jgi:L-arabinose isomerase|nr:L-fucose/L-arabinose isomerase family protein [Sphaerochaeta sp.]
MISRLKERTARVGLFGVGFDTYWSQFTELKGTLLGFHAELNRQIAANGVEVIDFGMVDSNALAFKVVESIKSARLDVLFCNMLTYATSSIVAPILRDSGIPLVLVALQPRARMDYSQANIQQQLENDNICSVPEFTSVAIRFGKPVQDVIIGCLYDDEEAASEIARWCDIAKVLHDLKGARFGLMGHVLESMYDMHVDPVTVTSVFGVHVPLLEIDDVLQIYRAVSEKDIQVRMDLILEIFDTPDPESDPLTMKLTDEDLYQSAKASIALERFVKEYNLTGLAYYYNGLPESERQLLVSSFIVGNSILNAQGFPMCGEFDLKTCIAMFIMDRLDIGGSFAEFHPFDFVEDFIFVGHDGPHHIAIADGRPVLRSLRKYHGKPGNGASVEFKIKEGPITMLGMTQDFNGNLKFIVGEGFSKAGPIPPTGNTNTRGFFEPNTKSFIKRWVMAGPTHHYALGVGHHADTIEKIAKVFGIECDVIR